MSDDNPSLTRRLQDTLHDHLADNGGGFPTEFVLVANYIDSDGDQAYHLAFSEDLALSGAIGILRWGTLAAEAEAARFFNDDE